MAMSPLIILEWLVGARYLFKFKVDFTFPIEKKKELGDINTRDFH